MTYRSERADQARTKNARGLLKRVKKCAQKSQKNVVVERARGSSKSIKCARKVETCQKMRAKISENCPAKARADQARASNARGRLKRVKKCAQNLRKYPTKPRADQTKPKYARGRFSVRAT